MLIVIGYRGCLVERYGPQVCDLQYENIFLILSALQRLAVL
jgi:hypothetical protein